MDIQIDLSSDWTEHLRSEITGLGYSADESDSPDELSYKFFNIKKRRIYPVARRLSESRNLSCPVENQAGYEALKKKIINGEDITPHLSKTILSDNYEDYLLNDWGIHHFHLGESIDNNFAERTGPLLFALIKDTDAYCINVLNHGAWTEQDLIKILHNEWPESISSYRINGILGLSHQPTNQEVAQLRRAGVQTMVQVEDNIVYGPIGGGYSTAGTSVQSGMLADRYNRIIRDIEKHVKNNTEIFIQKIKEHDLAPGEPPCFKLLVDETGFHVIETNSRVAFLVHPHNQG